MFKRALKIKFGAVAFLAIPSSWVCSTGEPARKCITTPHSYRGAVRTGVRY